MKTYLRDPFRGRAAELAARLANPDGSDPRTGDPDAIWTFAMDGTMPVCMTLDMLDKWWRSKSPQEKASIWERFLEVDPLAEADDVINLALAAIQHPLNVIVAEAELLASAHHKALDESTRFIQGRLQRCRRQHA